MKPWVHLTDAILPLYIAIGSPAAASAIMRAQIFIKMREGYEIA